MSLRPPDRQVLGERVAIRLRVSEGGFKDIVGILESETTLRKLDGTLLDFQPTEIVAWRKVEKINQGAGKGAPLSLRIREMEIAASQTWPARVQEKLGDWVLRATGKYTMRANSVLVLGDPGISLDDAINHVCTFYAEYGLPPRMHIPLPTFSNLYKSLQDRGWEKKTEAFVMVIDINPTEFLKKLDYEWSISDSFDDEWLNLQNDSGVSEIMKSVNASYASLRIAGQLVAVGRACNFEEWTVLTRLFVHPEYRGKGIGSELLSRLLSDAGTKGVSKGLLQVDVKNSSAINVYKNYGFKTHHSYCYLVLPSSSKAKKSSREFSSENSSC